MADVHDKKTRSYNMSMIKGKNTKPEIIVRKFLHANGYRFRLHYEKLPGKPDIVLPKHKIAIFINGCYWHGHENCKYFKPPKTNTQWWLNKIVETIERDNHKYEEIKNNGWTIKIIWECELKKLKIEETFKSLLEFIENEK